MKKPIDHPRNNVSNKYSFRVKFFNQILEIRFVWSVHRIIKYNDYMLSFITIVSGTKIGLVRNGMNQLQNSPFPYKYHIMVLDRNTLLLISIKT